MSETGRYALRFAIRCFTFYGALALVQWGFDGKVAWLPNLLPAAGFAAILTYVQIRIQMLRSMKRRIR